ncbi:MAG: SH3 domain-containing protein [Cyanobacteria bacterium J06576_12]
MTEGDNLEDAQVEISHEALIRNWPRLVEWLDEERSNLRHRLRLTFAAQQWAARNKESSMLLRGSLLEEAQLYSDLNDLELKFIQQSRRAKNKKIGIVSISVSIAFLALSILAVIALNRAKTAQDALAEAQNERDFAINETNRLREEEDRRKSLQDENGKLRESLNRNNIQIDENVDSSETNVQETNASIVGDSDFQKNIRTEPGTDFGVVGELEVGERVRIITSIRNKDDFPWYKIYYPPTNLEGWIAGHLVKVD